MNQLVKENVNVEVVRDIMGSDFFESEAVAEEINNRSYDKVIPEYYKMSEIPISEAEIRKYQKNGFFIVPGYSLAVEDFFHIFLADLDIGLDDSCREFSFAREEKVDSDCLYLVRKEIFPKSSGGSYPHWEQGLAGREEEIPRACELFYAMILYFIFTAVEDEERELKKGVCLFRRGYPICRDKVYRGFHPHIGFFPPENELGIRYHATYNINPCIGLAPIRKVYLY